MPFFLIVDFSLHQQPMPLCSCREVGIAVILNLQPLLFTQRGEHQRELVLEAVEFGGLRVRQVRRFKNEALGDVTALPQRIENDQIIEEVSVGCLLEHMGCAGCFSGFGPKPGPLNQ